MPTIKVTQRENSSKQHQGKHTQLKRTIQELLQNQTGQAHSKMNTQTERENTETGKN